MRARGWGSAASAALLCVAAAGCQVIHNADALPGETMTVENQGTSWTSVVGARTGIRHWTRIRVIAPPGATECISGSLSPLIQGGPQASGTPGRDRAVMLTTDPDSLTVHVRCLTPSGDVVRSVDGYRYEQRPRGSSTAFGFNIQPPMIHMDPADPERAARWDSLHAEVCTQVRGSRSGYLCRPEIFAALRASDIGEPNVPASAE